MALKTFLTTIANDEHALKAFKTDPDGAMKKAGLSHEDISLIKAKDAPGLSAKLKGVAKAAAQTIIVVIL